MRPFWHGFEKTGKAPIEMKRHAVVLYWSPEDINGERLKEGVRKLAFKYPTVKLKTVNVSKDPRAPERHKVKSFPTILLFKNGREVDRLSGKDNNITLLEQIFRRANV